jgi:hypothetical protein
MKVVPLAIGALALIATLDAASAQGIKLEEGETVVAANVKTGARFTIVVRGDASQVFYVDPNGVHLPLTRLVAVGGGQCNPGWVLECHASLGRPQRFCFCATASEKGRAIDTSTGEIAW